MKVGDLVIYKKEYSGVEPNPGIVIDLSHSITYNIDRAFVTVAFHNNIISCHKNALEVVNEIR
jgi:hypothetical protein